MNPTKKTYMIWTEAEWSTVTREYVRLFNDKLPTAGFIQKAQDALPADRRKRSVSGTVLEEFRNRVIGILAKPPVSQSRDWDTGQAAGFATSRSTVTDKVMAHKRPCPSCKELTAVNLSVCQECGSPTRWAPAVPQVEPLKDAPIPVPIHMAKPMVEQIGEEGMAKIQKSLEDSRVPNGYQKCPDCSKLFSVLTRECPYCAEATEVTTLERLSDSRKQDEAATALAERGSRVEANRPIVDLLITINAKVLELKGISGLDLLCAVVNPIDEKRVLNLVQQAADGLVFMEDLIRVATRHRK